TTGAACCPRRLGRRHSSAGLYFEIAPKWVFAGGGIYMPEPGDLAKIRQQIASEPQQFRRLVTAERLKAIGGIQGERLTRVPRGFPTNHPAAEYLRLKHYLGYREWPPAFATSDAFWPELLGTFAVVMPLVRYLNDTIGIDKRRERQ